MILIINNCQPNKLFLSLAAKNKVIIQENITLKYNEGEKILFYINKLLKKKKAQPQDIKSIIVNLGPGGFTSLRLAMLTVNTWSYVLKIPIYGFKNNYFNDLEKLLVLIKHKKGKSFLEPFYSAEPKITKPKKRG